MDGSMSIKDMRDAFQAGLGKSAQVTCLMMCSHKETGGHEITATYLKPRDGAVLALKVIAPGTEPNGAMRAWGEEIAKGLEGEDVD